MRLPALLIFACLFACIPPLQAAEKKKAAAAADPWLSPDGRYRVRIPQDGAADSAGQDAALVDAQSGASLLKLRDLEPNFAEGTRVLWSPDSQRFVFVTRNRRGNWCDYEVRRGEQWEDVQAPLMPDVPWKGHRRGSKTVGISWTPVRWSKPNVLLLEQTLEDDDGRVNKTRFTLTFDQDNHITIQVEK